MGRVFDFNMSRLCPAGSCAAPERARLRGPARFFAGAAAPEPATPRQFPDVSIILHCLHSYVNVTSQFRVRCSDTGTRDVGFSAFPGTRVATVGVFPARAVARTPHYVYASTVL